MPAPTSARTRTVVTDGLPAVPTVAALAAALGVDRTTLYRALRAEGTTPSALIRDVRLGRAAGRLARGASVATASAAAGYGDLSAFSRAFRRRYGVPPSRWAEAGGPILHTAPPDCNIWQSEG